MSFFSRKSENLLGVDISSTGVKLVELARARGGYELVSMAMVSLPRDAIVENTIVDSQAVADALINAVKIARTSTKNVAMAVSGNSVIIKTISIPAVSEFELEAQIQFEADQHVPYDIEDVFLDFHIQGVSAADPDQIDVVLVACKREVIEDYRKVLGDAGLVPKCVDCAVFALENASEIGETRSLRATSDVEDEEEAEVHALINIGANMMNINVQIDGQMAFVRDQFYGGNNLTEEIQKHHGISHAAAEQLKVDAFDTIDPVALENFYVGLTSELVRSLDFYSASRPEHPVRKLLISGGCALIPGIAEELEQRLGIDAVILNPFDHIKLSARKFDEQSVRSAGPMLTVPVGLALRSFDQ